MGIEEVHQFYNKKIQLIVDGRAYSVTSIPIDPKSNVSLQLTAKLVGETERFISLEEIIFNNAGIFESTSKKGIVNKDYVIGIFELPESESS